MSTDARRRPFPSLAAPLLVALELIELVVRGPAEKAGKSTLSSALSQIRIFTLSFLAKVRAASLGSPPQVPATTDTYILSIRLAEGKLGNQLYPPR